MAKSISPSAPKNSMLKNVAAIGQLITPQNRQISPIAAPKTGSMPNNGAKTQPKVEPIKSVGTISPPLNPKLMVNAVKIIFSINASGCAVPEIAFSIIAEPAPL